MRYLMTVLMCVSVLSFSSLSYRKIASLRVVDLSVNKESKSGNRELFNYLREASEKYRTYKKFTVFSPSNSRGTWNTHSITKSGNGGFGYIPQRESKIIEELIDRKLLITKNQSPVKGKEIVSIRGILNFKTTTRVRYVDLVITKEMEELLKNEHSFISYIDQLH